MYLIFDVFSEKFGLVLWSSIDLKYNKSLRSMQPVQYNQFFDERPNTTPQAPTELLSIKPIQCDIPMGIPVNRIKYVYPEQGVTYLYPQANAPQPPTQPTVSMVAMNLPNYANGQSHSTKIICPRCSERVQTRVEKEAGLPAFAGCVAMSCLLPLFCWIPMVAECCQDTRHFCPKCGAKVGKKYAPGCCT